MEKLLNKMELRTRGSEWMEDIGTNVKEDKNGWTLVMNKNTA